MKAWAELNSFWSSLFCAQDRKARRQRDLVSKITYKLGSLAYPTMSGTRLGGRGSHLDLVEADRLWDRLIVVWVTLAVGQGVEVCRQALQGQKSVAERSGRQERKGDGPVAISRLTRRMASEGEGASSRSASLNHDVGQV